jgi:hypothetical protein
MRASGICGSDLNLYRKPSFDRAVICGRCWLCGMGYTQMFTLDQADDAYRRVEARQMGKGVFVFEPN